MCLLQLIPVKSWQLKRPGPGRHRQSQPALEQPLRLVLDHVPAVRHSSALYCDRTRMLINLHHFGHLQPAFENQFHSKDKLVYLVAEAVSDSVALRSSPAQSDEFLDIVIV